MKYEIAEIEKVLEGADEGYVCPACGMKYIREASQIIRDLLAELKEARKAAFLEAAEHLMKPQPSTTTFCCLSTLFRAADALRWKTEEN